MRCHPLPGPALRRRLTLVARRRELGKLPSDLAAAIHAALESDSLPRLRALSAALTDGIIIAPG